MIDIVDQRSWGDNLYLVGARPTQEPHLSAQMRGSFGPELLRRRMLEFRIPTDRSLKGDAHPLPRKPVTAEEIMNGSAQVNEVGGLQ
jgi:hypothetical protein